MVGLTPLLYFIIIIIYYLLNNKRTRNIGACFKSLKRMGAEINIFFYCKHLIKKKTFIYSAFECVGLTYPIV